MCCRYGVHGRDCTEDPLSVFLAAEHCSFHFVPMSPQREKIPPASRSAMARSSVWRKKWNRRLMKEEINDSVASQCVGGNVWRLPGTLARNGERVRCAVRGCDIRVRDCAEVQLYVILGSGALCVPLCANEPPAKEHTAESRSAMVRGSMWRKKWNKRLMKEEPNDNVASRRVGREV
jgi:hypothetical protein